MDFENDTFYLSEDNTTLGEQDEKETQPEAGDILC